MKIKRYKAGCAYAGEEEMVQVGDGAYVSFEDYAALLKERDALTADNACLKQSIEEVAEAFETGTDGALATAVDEAVNLTTPATDGVLKRIHAQVVEMLADHLSGLNIMASETSVREFAAQLRKEPTHD